MPPALVIFDCDGVLVDSEPLASESLREALDEVELSLSQSEVDEHFRGRSLTDIVGTIERRLGRRLPETFVPDLDRRTFAAFRKDLKPVRGVTSVLEHLQARSVPVCVASSGTLEKMRFTLGLTDLLRFFDSRLFSATEVKHGKPAPDLFLHAAKRMGVPIEAAVIVEDSLPGVRAGTSAGARVLAFTSPSHPKRDAHLRALSDIASSSAAPPTPFSSMEDLPALLDLPPDES